MSLSFVISPLFENCTFFPPFPVDFLKFKINFKSLIPKCHIIILAPVLAHNKPNLIDLNFLSFTPKHPVYAKYIDFSSDLYANGRISKPKTVELWRP